MRFLRFPIDRRRHRPPPARVTGLRPVEPLERRTLLSVSPIDPTFNPREPGVAFSTTGRDVAVQADGKVLVAETRRVGNVSRMAVSRLNVDGSLDTTFGTGGRAYADFGDASDSVSAMDLGPTGKIVIVGGAGPFGTGADYALAVFNANGTPDRSFGGDGTVTMDLGNTSESLSDVRFDAAGRVVATGSNGSSFVNIFRFTASGSPDLSFGGNDGWLQTPYKAPSAVLTLPDNRIVVAGINGRLGVRRLLESGATETNFEVPATAPGYPNDLALQPDGKVIAATGNGQFSIFRFTTSGAPDTTFGTNGVVTSDLGAGSEDATGVAVQADGKIVASGIAFPQNGGYDFYTVRYLPTGAPDPSFGGDDGVVSTDFQFGSTDFARSVALAPGGRIVVAGDVDVLYADVQTAGVARYNADGSPDATFGGDGTVLDTFDGGHRRSINTMRRQGDGKLVVAGTQQVGLEFDFFVARYLPDSRRDPSFGDGGITVTDFDGRYDEADALLIQPDGKIVVGGKSDGPAVNNVTDDHFALARYTTAGRLDPSFDGDGRVVTEIGARNDEGIRDLDLYPGGRIVAAGFGGVARYNADGSPDRSFATDGTLNEPNLRGIAGAVSGDKILYAAEGFVRRVNADGTADPTFNFQYIPPPPSPVNDPEEGEPYTVFTGMDLDPSGRIIVGGTYHPRDYSDDITAFAVQRYLPTGAPDTTFGTGGQTISDFTEFSEEEATDLAVAPDGKPVLVGRGYLGGEGYVPLVARYTTDGRLDGSFGYNGKAFVEGYFTAGAVTVEPDGDVLMAVNGFSQSYGSGFGSTAVFRFYGDARPGAVLDRSLGTVFVTGTSGNDAIRIDPTGGRMMVYVNGRRQTFTNRTFKDVVVYGGDGNDTITVDGRIVHPTRVFGGNGNDRLVGGVGPEELYGEAGDDTLDGGLGGDILGGGEGIDTVDYSSRTAPVVVSRYGATDEGEVGEKDVVFNDIEIARGGSGNDRLEGFQVSYGNAGNDTLSGDYGRDALWGGDGDDLLVGGPGVVGNDADYFRGGAGTDTVSYADRFLGVVATIDGVANDGTPAANGGPGEGDNVYTDVENVIGGNGNDNITGSDANNNLNGGAGDDVISGGGGNDTISGGEGNNTLRGGAGDDVIYGGGGDDTIDGGAGYDSLDGGYGDDTVDFSSLATPVTVHLLTSEYNDSGRFYKYGTADTPGTRQETFSDFENVTGGAGNDVIYGDWRDNVLAGGPGNDSIYGGAGADTLAGGDGADTLRGEDDQDVFVDAPGTDTDDLRFSARLDDQGLLRVFGTDGPDNISLLLVGDTILLTGSVGTNGRTTSPAAAVKSVWIDGNAGDDSVTIGNADGTSMPQVKAHLAGGPGNDTLIAGNGDDELWGGLGVDILDGGLGSDTVWGGGGSDTADYSRRSTGVFVRLAGAFGDYAINPLFGSAGATASVGGVQGENDQIRYDVLTARGGSGQDLMSGKQDTVLQGGPGDDELYMPASLYHVSNITLDGGPGNDSFDTDDSAGGTMLGGEGNDHFKLDWNADPIVVNGGPGSDTVEAARHWGDPFVFDAAGKNVEVIYGSDAGDVITGTDAAEKIDGREGNDTIVGNGRDDTLIGGEGDDDLRGGDGNDTLTGGPGKDQLRGNAGKDTLYASGDGSSDFLDGGSGTDRARKDSNDFAQYVEQILA